MTLRENIIANAVGRIWGLAAIYLFAPIYLRLLGVEAFGLVGFYATLTGVLAFGDVGFTATLAREMARLSAQPGNEAAMGALLKTYEVVYGVVVALMTFGIWLGAPWIADHWLRVETLASDRVVAAIRYMSVAGAMQLILGFHTGGLMGLQRQVMANALQVAAGIVRGAGAVLALYLVERTIVVFAFWQMLSNVGFAFVARATLWGAIRPKRRQAPFTMDVIRKTWRYAAGMAGIAFVSTILTQFDKLWISKTLPLESVGYYSLAGGLAMLPLVVAGPIAMAAYPRLAGLAATGERAALLELYQKTCQLVGVIAIPLGLTVAAFAGELVWIWTGSTVVGPKVNAPAAFLVVAQLLQTLTLVPFYAALAYGEVRIILCVQMASVVLLAMLLFALVGRLGMLGASLAWLSLNICIVPPYMFFLHRKILHGEFPRWLKRAVLSPAIISIPIVIAGRWVFVHSLSRVICLAAVALIVGVAVWASSTAIPGFQRKVWRHLCGLVGQTFWA